MTYYRRAPIGVRSSYAGRTDRLFRFMGIAFAMAVVFGLITVYMAFKLDDCQTAASQKNAIRSTSQKSAIRESSNIGHVVDKLHTPGYWFNMHATTGARTVTMPYYKPDIYQVLIYGKINNRPVTIRRTVAYAYWQRVSIGDTVTLK